MRNKLSGVFGKRILVAAATLLLLALPAIAADSDGLQGKPKDTSVSWAAIAYSAVFAAAIAVVAFKNSKRTHLD